VSAVFFEKAGRSFILQIEALDKKLLLYEFFRKQSAIRKDR
jgi:hypothetical protein